MKNSAEVLVGVGTLYIREPNNALAEWSTIQQYAGTQSVKLSKGGSGNAGSTHVQFNVATRGITMTQWTNAIITNSFYHHANAVTGNFAQYEFRFEDPDSDAWVEITAVPLQTYLGTNAWVQTTLADNTPSGYGGVDEVGLSIFNWALADLSNQQGVIEGVTTGGDCSNWILSRIRLELWEAEPERTQYIDSVEVMGITYTIEPGGTAPALSLSSPFEELGYTEDGVTVTLTSDTVDIEVEEETFPIARPLIKETAEITVTLAQTTLRNLNIAIAGSVLVGNILTMGAGVQKTFNLKLEGKDQAGLLWSILIPKATALGAVGFSYKKDEKTMIPCTFQALKPANENAITIVKNTN